MHDKAWLIAKAKKGQGLRKRAYISNKSDLVTIRLRTGFRVSHTGLGLGLVLR